MSDHLESEEIGGTPLVSVLMPVFNGERHLRDAIDSLLAQTFEDFELIIVNDGSTDQTSDILADYSDSRLIILDNDGNRGIAYSMNRALHAARGEYVARLDGDDVALPERLAIHVGFLKDNPELLFAAGGINLIDEHGQRFGRYCPAITASGIAWTSFFKMPIANPTFIFRRAKIIQQQIKHSEDFPTADDYAFLNEVLKLGSGVVLADPLVDYRVHSGSTSVFRRPEQIKEHVNIALSRLFDVFPDMAPYEAEFRKIIHAAQHEYPLSSQDALACVRAVDILFRRFVKSNDYLSLRQTYRLQCWTSAYLLRATMVGGGLGRRPISALGFFLRQPVMLIRAISELVFRYLLKTPR